MNEPHRGRSAPILLVLIAVGLLTVGYRQGATGPFAVLKRGATTAIAPVQEGLAAVVRPIGGAFVSFARLGTLRAENARLRADLATAEQRQVSLVDLSQENAELRELLRMRERLRLETTAGEVIAPPPSSTDWRVLIDVGGDEGVRAGMAVINDDGLVGKISEVTQGYAWVELATNPSAGYAVRITQTGEVGALSGRGSQPYQLEVFDTEAEVPPEADIVTQAYAGGRIPDGLPIGKGLFPRGGLAQGTRFVEVSPYVDFTALRSVLVVLNAPSVPQNFAADQLVADPDAPRPPPFDENAAAESEAAEEARIRQAEASESTDKEAAAGGGRTGEDAAGAVPRGGPRSR